MKQKVLIDVEIKCEPPNYVYRWYKGIEEKAKAIEAWVKEFHEFIRDHRSQDPISLDVTRVYQDQCGFCGDVWEVNEDGCPVCCNMAIEEWERQKSNVSA